MICLSVHVEPIMNVTDGRRHKLTPDDLCLRPRDLATWPGSSHIKVGAMFDFALNIGFLLTPEWIRNKSIIIAILPGKKSQDHL